MAILDADKEGFLRSETSLIQTIGRCARNVNAAGHPLRRQGHRLACSRPSTRPTAAARSSSPTTEHGITPETIRKAIRTALADQVPARETAREAIHASEGEFDQTELVARLEEEMLEAAEALEFEQAAQLRDRITAIKGEPPATAKKIAGMKGMKGIGKEEEEEEEEEEREEPKKEEDARRRRTATDRNISRTPRVEGRPERCPCSGPARKLTRPSCASLSPPSVPSVFSVPSVVAVSASSCFFFFFFF